MRHGFTSSQVATWQQQYNRTTLFSQQLMQESSNFKYDMVLKTGFCRTKPLLATRRMFDSALARVDKQARYS